jgi:hypothetical protein
MNQQMKVMSICGTRPEMIKMWATLKKLDELNFDHVMVHTGQNFTPELRDFFFRDLKLRKPDYELDIDTSSGYGPEVADVIRKSDWATPIAGSACCRRRIAASGFFTWRRDCGRGTAACRSSAIAF